MKFFEGYTTPYLIVIIGFFVAIFPPDFKYLSSVTVQHE